MPGGHTTRYARAGQVPALSGKTHSLLTGNEAIGLGLVAGGLSHYISYPMTPSSTLLHFLAGNAERLGITVIHPENEIGVILMGLGGAVAGAKTAVGTSGGGFCLMTEGLSFAGMAEIPIVIVVSQRTGPSTGLPTYTGQAELQFVLHAGQGEFPRLIVAPADPGEAYRWSAAAMRLAWKYQIPAFVLPIRPCRKEPTASITTRLVRSPGGRSRALGRAGSLPAVPVTPRPASPLSHSRAGKMRS